LGKCLYKIRCKWEDKLEVLYLKWRRSTRKRKRRRRRKGRITTTKVGMSG
jgi:hypothetical protein